MKDLSATLLTEKAALQTASCIAARIGSLRVCDWDQTLTLDGETYTAGVPIKRPKLNERGGSLVIGNVDDALTSLIINGATRNAAVEVYEVFLDETNTVAGAEVLFSGVVDGQAFNDTWATFTLTRSRNQAVARCPRRRLVPACGFIFKSGDCGYTGASGPCAKTRDTCLNLSRFAGFRFIPAPGRTFTWGDTVYKVT